MHYVASRWNRWIFFFFDDPIEPSSRASRRDSRSFVRSFVRSCASNGMKMNEWMNGKENESISRTFHARIIHRTYTHTHTHIIFILFMHITRTPTHTPYTPIIYHSIHIDLINNSIRLILFYLCITNRIHIIKRSSSSHASHSLTRTHPSFVHTSFVHIYNSYIKSNTLISSTIVLDWYHLICVYLVIVFIESRPTSRVKTLLASRLTHRRVEPLHHRHSSNLVILIIYSSTTYN